jgi:hypothetical protein
VRTVSSPSPGNRREEKMNIITGLVKGNLKDGEGYAIYDTELDKFVTSNWLEKDCHKILNIWHKRNPKLNMTRYELRHRYYVGDDGYDNSVILIIGNNDPEKRIKDYYHWYNRGYARGYEDCYYIHYYPPEGKEMQDICSRFDESKWDGTGKRYEIIDGEFKPVSNEPAPQSQ